MENSIDFSASYDDLIKTINTKWLQIKIQDTDPGYFLFNITNGECSLLASKIKEKTTFKEFLDIVIKHLDERLAGSLTIIRDNITNVAKRSAVALMNKLQGV